jgi:hypothetical protein
MRVRLRLIVDVLRENKEFIVGPAITLVPQLFSLPLFISSFVFDCQNLEDSWLRHFLIVSYWISFTPQWTSFFLFPFLKERVLQTENVCLSVCLSVCPTNQKAAFPNMPGKADFPFKSEWS